MGIESRNGDRHGHGEKHKNLTEKHESIEKIPSFRRCFKRWGTVGLAVGGLFFVGENIRLGLEHEKEYEEHLNNTYSAEELKRAEALETEIIERFGVREYNRLVSGDKDAYFARQEKRNLPTIKGFDGYDLDSIQKRFFSEEYGVVPRGWIAGEIKTIAFEDSLNIDDTKQTLGDFSHILGDTMVLYRTHETTGKPDAEIPVSLDTVLHEFGHANDWETDMDLNLLERQELLLKIHERMTAESSWIHDHGADHFVYDDTANANNIVVAREYWADITTEYLTKPASFKEKYPDDFELVDTYVKKNDPSFDVFRADRGPYDSETGELKE